MLRPAVVAWLATLLCGPHLFADSGWLAGAARVCITPDQSMWMSGYASRTKPAEGKLHDLWAKALVLQDPEGHRVVLITMDLVGVPRELSVSVCAELKQLHGLTREAILLNTSHTHSGPVVRSNLIVMYELDETQRRYVAEYGAQLHNKLVAVVGEALKDLKPVNVAWGSSVVTFAVNRRNNKEAAVPKLRELGQLKGPVDHDLPVLSIRNPEGKLHAVVFGYACHATVLSGQQWCGDYPGFAQLAVEQAHPDCLALFWAGCGADQNPLPRRSVALAEEYGRQLADGVESVLRAPMQPITGSLTPAYTEIDLPFADLPSRDKLLDDAMNRDRSIAARAKLLLAQLEKQGVLRGSYPYPVQTWRLGDGPLWFALGGEVVVDYALRLKKEAGPGPVWVAGYANDVMSYIPSLRVLKEGGYEGGGAMVYYGLPTVWSPRIEELIVEAAKSQAGKLRTPR
jgi:hypothetical protein